MQLRLCPQQLVVVVVVVVLLSVCLDHLWRVVGALVDGVVVRISHLSDLLKALGLSLRRLVLGVTLRDLFPVLERRVGIFHLPCYRALVWTLGPQDDRLLALPRQVRYSP